MPTFPGSIFPGSTYQEPPSWSRSPEISELETVVFPFDAAASSVSQSGTKLDTQPIDEPQISLNGGLLPAFGADWYYRIHIIPSTIDLGNMVSLVERVLEVWNARFDVQTLNAINESGADGLMLSGQSSPPLTFGPLQSRLYTFVADMNGAPVINATYSFVFASGSTALLVVRGRRVIVFGLCPDWSQGITERLEWLTEVLESYDGTEQRIRLRQIPRRSFEYRFLLEGLDVRVLEHLLFAWGARIYALPVWTDVSILAGEAAVGSTTLTVQNVANSDYHADGLAVLWRSNTQHEAVEILSITGDTLTLKLPLSRSWPSGTRVFPARLARIEGEVALARPTDTIAIGRCRFRVEDVTAPAAVDYGPAYRDYLVFDWRPDRSVDIEDKWRRKVAVIDYGTGLATFDDQSGKPIIGRTLTWLLSDRSKVSAFRGWLAARAGRAYPCWLPTFESDLEVVHTVAATDTGIIVRNVGYARFVAANPLRRDLRIITTAGTFYRRITGANEISDDEELLSLDVPLGVTLQPQQFLQVSYLELSRLDQDVIEIHWETDSIARVQLSTRTLKS